MPLRKLKALCTKELGAFTKKQLKRILRAKPFTDEHGVLVDATNFVASVNQLAAAPNSQIGLAIGQFSAATSQFGAPPNIQQPLRTAQQLGANGGLIVVEDEGNVHEEEIELDLTRLLNSNATPNDVRN